VFMLETENRSTVPGETPFWMGLRNPGYAGNKGDDMFNNSKNGRLEVESPSGRVELSGHVRSNECRIETAAETAARETYEEARAPVDLDRLLEAQFSTAATGSDTTWMVRSRSPQSGIYVVSFFYALGIAERDAMKASTGKVRNATTTTTNAEFLDTFPVPWRRLWHAVTFSTKHPRDDDLWVEVKGKKRPYVLDLDGKRVALRGFNKFPLLAALKCDALSSCAPDPPTKKYKSGV